ncbi:GNAT family N-acetyltransferase [Sphingomonas sp. HMWF008]|nr:GNAT family N-acetyltransferase [Sphingomonas sp. HMWF008]
MNDPVVVTSRLWLRVPQPSDRAALHAMWTDPVVMANLAPVKDTDAALARHDSYRHEGLGFWVVARREDGAAIGFCGLKRGNPGSPIEGLVEIGWIFAAPFWGQGYAHEAAAASLAWAWQNVREDRIVAITAARNLKSQGLMERLGLRRVVDGDFDHPALAPGDPLRRTVLYEILRPA